MAEAAYAADVPDKMVNREIDADIVESVEHLPSGDRLVDRSAVLYLAAIAGIRNDLSKSLRLQLLRSLEAKKRSLSLGLFRLDVASVNKMIRPRLAELDRLRSGVAIDPEVCGGDPVIKGTRIRVHKIATLLGQDAPVDELMSEFGLSEHQVGLARLYACLHPKRGRRAIIPKDVVEHVPAHR